MIGQSYRVEKSFASASYTFSASEVLIFEKDQYSRYDNCTVYVFRDAINGIEAKEWWLQDEQSSDRWKEFFEVV
jgi:hypothetical protein